VVMAQVAPVLRIGSPSRTRQVGVAAVKNSRRPGLLTRKVATAAQFLTLRLILSVATEDICGDSEGPGHAPTLPLCWA